MSMSKESIIREIFKFNRRFIAEDLSPAEKYDWLQRFVMYTSDELMEVLEELPFKHWKQYDLDTIDEQRILEELADVLIFTFGMVDILGFDEEDIFAEIAAKNEINIARQENGY